jgi:hypothetical protein
LPPRYLKPNPFDGTQTFCVVRDPLDRMLSEFKMDADDASHVNRSDRATRALLRRRGSATRARRCRSSTR